MISSVYSDNMLMDFILFRVGSEFLYIVCMDFRLQRVDIWNVYVSGWSRSYLQEQK